MIHGNEILKQCLADPFDDFSEKYDKGLFQFQSNEVNLDVYQETFNKLNYEDSVVISNNLMTIKGIVKYKKSRPLKKSGIVTLQDGNIRTKENVNSFQSLDPFWNPPEIILQRINEVSEIFQSVDADFGESPVQSEMNFRKIYQNMLGLNSIPSENDIESAEVTVYRLKNSGRYLLIKLDLKKVYYVSFDNNNKSVSVIFSKPDGDWVKIEDFTGEDSPFFRSYIEEKVLAELEPDKYSGRKYLKFIWDTEDNECFCFLLSNIEYAYFFNVYAIDNYRSIAPYALPCFSDRQEFVNIISDLCFLFNSYFYVENFSRLVIKGNGTPAYKHGILYSHDFIKDINQDVVDYEYTDYHMKSFGGLGNAFMIPQYLIDGLNNFYRRNFVKTLITEIEACRVGEDNPFRYMNIHDGIIDGIIDDSQNIIKNGENLGVIRIIDFSKDGKQAVYILHRHLTENEIENGFNDWWRI